RYAAGIAAYAQAHPEWMVLLGAPPTEPEPDYGWIEPGEHVGSIARGPLYRVRRVWEKPPADVARGLFEHGCLWSTFVLAARVAALIDGGRRCLPLLHDRLLRLGVFLGTTHEAWALRQAYLLAPRADFARAVLGASSLPCLAVAEMTGVTWSDLGTPERVAHGL